MGEALQFLAGLCVCMWVFVTLMVAGYLQNRPAIIKEKIISK